MRKLLVVSSLVAMAMAHGCSCDNTGEGNMPDLTAGSDDLSVPVDMAVQTDQSVPLDMASGGGDGCRGVTSACAVNGDCCSGLCDPGSHTCVNKMCGMSGASCATAADCCGLQCLSNKCMGQCVSDNQPCSSSGQCCSTICGMNGTCTPLNTTCSTAGNACASTGDGGTFAGPDGGLACCSGVCTNGQCAPPSTISFCTQIGDICLADTECCTGICNKMTGASAGTCAPLTNATCSVDGIECNGCGTCCSHFCGPFGSSSVSICQPASGCHVNGDTCHKNSDCCGGAPTNGLPGAGQVVCTPDPTYPTKIGTCSPPNVSNCPAQDGGTCTGGGNNGSCNPAGDICHQTMTAICAGGTTNVRNDCCACISTKDCCKLDKTGIPRCFLEGTCVAQGGVCSFNGDCCGGLPCVPDSMGTLRCGFSGCDADAGACCSPAGGACTTNADCCVGLPCVVAPGALAGTCGGAVNNPDGGTTVPDLAGNTSDLAVCAQYGQACTTSASCCNSIPCVNSAFGACQPGQACSCLSLIP